jgi:hypothetical protein
MTARSRLVPALVALPMVFCAQRASAEVIVVQCVVEEYRTTFGSRPDSFIVQVDLEARAITTNFGTTSLKTTRRMLRGTGNPSGGWQTSISIDRNTGRLEAGIDRMEGLKHSFAEVKGICVLPEVLQGARYRRAGT